MVHRILIRRRLHYTGGGRCAVRASCISGDAVVRRVIRYGAPSPALQRLYYTAVGGRAYVDCARYILKKINKSVRTVLPPTIILEERDERGGSKTCCNVWNRTIIGTFGTFALAYTIMNRIHDLYRLFVLIPTSWIWIKDRGRFCPSPHFFSSTNWDAQLLSCQTTKTTNRSKFIKLASLQNIYTVL